LDFDQLAVFMFVLPTNPGQNIQTVGAAWQRVLPDLPSLIPLLIIAAGDIHTFLSFPSHKQGAVQGLDRFPTMPVSSGLQSLPTDGTGFDFSLENQPLGIRIFPVGTMARLFFHASLAI